MATLTKIPLVDVLVAALERDDVTGEHFPAGTRDWLAHGDDVCGFTVKASNADVVTVALDGGYDVDYHPVALARAVLDA